MVTAVVVEVEDGCGVFGVMGVQTCGCLFFFQAEDGIRDHCVTGVQTCALPISQTRIFPGSRILKSYVYQLSPCFCIVSKQK